MSGSLVDRLTDTAAASVWRRLPWSAAVAVFTVAATASVPPERTVTPIDALGWALLVVPALALAYLPSLPMVVATMSAAAPVAFYGCGYQSIFAATSAVVVTFFAVLQGRGRHAIAVTAVLVLGILTVGIARGADADAAVEGPLWILAWMLAAAAGGEALRRRGQLLAAERRRADDAARLGAERERLRIARELHDSLTHSISVINVQAGVAAHLAEAEPDRVPTALAAIRDASADAMRELRSTVEVLRHITPDGDPADEPGPSLAQLPRLIETATAAGLMFHVKHRPEDTPTDLPLDIDRAAYRVVQEALSNAARHAPGADVRLSVELGHDTLALTIHNGPPKSTPHTRGGGLGLIGMRERVNIVGGELTARPNGEGFLVRALLPLHHKENRR
ncbi:sensor histidine kinase [Phytomonospora endophytica]|uniref:histidine kinase n=1 Tax=Phytomonospora endophytica TaxID=714109 RepID=A0A841G2W6_9ACTN|nr:histidine kinase [Phytomonospora endophytica]MBB6038470.1 signal transduction histidine kinase [Phytomonospora endophytica]GIG64399.1 hypothetical protein Pen01_06940 [Phytomonospora endophytica]